MTRNFCTFFDKNYLTRGLALYYSLEKHYPDFVLWILCMDEQAFDMLTKLNLPKIKLLKVTEVEDARMLEVKPTRTVVEYMWMFGAQLSLYMLEKMKVDMITYLDADMHFYSSPEEIYREFGNKSIMIIPHGYSEKNKFREKTSGIYNVGMLIFRNDEYARECVNWWKDRVVEWCYNRYEDGKMGDQMYLDDWTTRFKNVHVLKHMGANVAPWNIARFDFKKDGDKITGTEKTTGIKFPLIFYHFHPIKIYMGSAGKIRAYPITIYNREIYRQYLKSIQKAYDTVRAMIPGWTGGTAKKLDIFRFIKQYVTILVTRS